jgi:mannose-6-phosphate isomerase-like protein (cupin superfamily)
MKSYFPIDTTLRIPAVVLALLLGASAFPQSAAPGPHTFTASETKSGGKALSSSLDEHKLAVKVLLQDGNTKFQVAHREGSGQAEWHEKQADIMFISEGSATLTVGGKVVGGQTTAPGEIRGSSIEGGAQVTLHPGDVQYIPPKTAHMMSLKPGEQITYFVTKVDK